MLEECVMAAIHFVPSLGLGVGVGGLASDNFGRPDVPEVSLQPLRENLIMRTLPPFFFHILARNSHPLCS